MSAPDQAEINTRLEAAVTAMTKPENVYDVTIICTTDDHQADFWMSKLGPKKEGDDAKAGAFPLVIAVSEDWGGSGAGNGLGTLYAWQKAVKYAKEKLDGLDLVAKLSDGSISAALYHTAGKGTRLAPLPASENNNKPGVKLPFLGPNGEPLTVLEAVVRQTGIYAPSRKGRMSVYWGDQVFLPSVETFAYTPTHHIDIMCTLLGDTAPTAEEWTEQGLDKYGVIAVMKAKDDNTIAEAAQVEKVDHPTAVQMLGSLGEIGQVGPSLGSFSVSAAILTALCAEYDKELTEKTAKLDTDPDFWMPLTLSEADYMRLMKQKDIEETVSGPHYKRMAAFKKGFDMGEKMGLFGAVNVGKSACWWDYGQLKLYSKNSLLLLEDSNTECALLKKFLSISDEATTSKEGEVDLTHSYMFISKIGKGTVKDSLVCKVETKELSADGAILVNCVAPKITAGKGAILYNVMSETEIVAKEGEVKVEVTPEEGEPYILTSRMDIDGKKAWKNAVGENKFSFEEVHKKNKQANISKIEEARATKRRRICKDL